MRGEVTIVVSGAVPVAAVSDDPEALRTSVAELEEEGMSRKDAIVETARLAGVPKRTVYNLVHRIMTRRLTSYYRDGLTFDVRDEGPLDGPVAVLLHGFPERSSSWRDVAPVLHAHGHPHAGARPARLLAGRPAAVDAATTGCRCSSTTSRPSSSGSAGRSHLVGHDWGAIVGWGLAATQPDLVRTLTAVSVPHPAAFLHAMLTSGQGLKSRYMLMFQLPFLPERLARHPGGTLRRAAPARRDDRRRRGPVPPRDRGVRRPAGRAGLVPRDAAHRPPGHAGPGHRPDDVRLERPRRGRLPRRPPSGAGGTSTGPTGSPSSRA